MLRRTRHKKDREPHTVLERRTWEPWTEKENNIFFESLEKHSRNWAEIAKDIGTKKQEQVRTYYYRVLRKINRLLQLVHFSLDSRDRINTLIALISFWEIKCECVTEDHTLEFATLLKDRILRQRQSLESMRAYRLPSPDVLSFYLIPRNEDIAKFVSSAGFNPKLQLSIHSNYTLSFVIEQITRKWVDEERLFIGTQPIKLYPHGFQSHKGYGDEDKETHVLALYHTMGCPNVCKLEYEFGEKVPTIKDDTLMWGAMGQEEEAEDFGMDANPIFQELIVPPDYRELNVEQASDRIKDERYITGYDAFSERDHEITNESYATNEAKKYFAIEPLDIFDDLIHIG